jgi:hypothetical protein
MYSPKISEELIPHLYRWAKSDGVKMTVLINRMIEKEVKKYLEGGDKHAGQDKANSDKHFGRV